MFASVEAAVHEDIAHNEATAGGAVQFTSESGNPGRMSTRI